MKDHVYVKPGRDYTVELWRFLFCIAVLGLHFFSKTGSTIFRAGYLGVEFFFLLSGYGVFVFYTKQMERKEWRKKFSAIGIFVGGRLRRLYPMYAISLLMMLLLRCVRQGWSFAAVISFLKTEWAEFLWLQCGPFGNEILIVAHWYVPVCFWGSLILLLLLLFSGRIGGYLLCPIISFSIYGYYFRLIRKIDVIYSYHAILRGIAGLSLGIFIGFVLRALRDKTKEEQQMISPVSCFLYVGANLLLFAVLVYMNFGRRSAMDFVVIGIFAVSMAILLFLRMPLPQKVCRCFAALSAASYPIYIFQMPVIELLLGP